MIGRLIDRTLIVWEKRRLRWRKDNTRWNDGLKKDENFRFCLCLSFQLHYATIIARISSHSSTIRQRLPQLKRIVSISFMIWSFTCDILLVIQDDTDLPAQIGFAIDNEAIRLPPSNPHCVPQDMQDFLAKFIEEYYRLFDTRGRGELHACYHNSCIFSLCVAPTEGSMVPTKPYKYGPLIYDSRNFKRIFDDNKRANLLRHGKTDVLDFLRIKFPVTKHEGKSFRVDVISTSVSFIVHWFFHRYGCLSVQNNRAVFTVNGLYKEGTCFVEECEGSSFECSSGYSNKSTCTMLSTYIYMYTNSLRVRKSPLLWPSKKIFFP